MMQRCAEFSSSNSRALCRASIPPRIDLDALHRYSSMLQCWRRLRNFWFCRTATAKFTAFNRNSPTSARNAKPSAPRPRSTQAQLETAKTRVKQIESDRKQLELDVEGKKSQIEKYANQQLQTRKNEEYRALAHEIETCKADITQIEDQEIVLMEQAEAAQKEVVRAHARSRRDEKTGRRPDRPTRPARGKFQEGTRRIAAGPGGTGGRGGRIRAQRYERLFKSKGENVVVGVHHGVCGGCHMKLPAQMLVTCQAPEGNRDLLELRPDFVLHARHGAGRGGVTHSSRLIHSPLCSRQRLPIPEGKNIPAGHGTVQIVVYQAGHRI